MNDLRQRLGDAPQLTRGLVAGNQISPKQPEPDTCEHIVNIMLEHTVEELGKAISNLETRMVSVLNQPPAQDAASPMEASGVDGSLRRKLFDLRERLAGQINWINELTSRINV